MGDPLLKKKAIEYCDRRLVGHALSLLAARGAAPVRIAVLPDHYTPCETRTHDPTPVPFLIHGPGIGPDTATVFTEASCATGGLGRVEGTGFLPLVLRGP